MKLLFAASALIALSGCALTPPTRDVTSQRVFVPLNPPGESTTKMTVARDQGLYGAGCSSRIFLDGQLIVQVEQGEHVTVPIPDGSHRLKLTHFGACESGSQELTEATATRGNLSYRIAANGRSIEAVKGS